ncbi:MAG TPA: hypothetical protein VI381_02140, partial [Allosphingosinicella sp.]
MASGLKPVALTSPARKARPHAALFPGESREAALPPFWIPAFAGMLDAGASIMSVEIKQRV